MQSRNNNISGGGTNPAGPDSEELTGSVDNITYHNEKNGYTVCSIKPPGPSKTNPPVTLVGKCAAIWVGEEICANGRWVRHPQHGLQFEADSIVCIAPTSVEGIQRYLASGMIRGIGKVNAKRLVDYFGEQTLDIIEKHSARLEEVEGIGPIRRKRIKESWNEQRGIRDIMIFLQSNGVGTAQSARIYRTYGHDAIALVKRNPYRLCHDVWGIGFKTADTIAQRVGIPRNSPLRARAGILYALQSQTDEGHCFGIQAELLLQAQALLGISVELLADALQEELATGALVQEEDRIYLAPLAQAEKEVATKLKKLLDTQGSFKPIEAKKAVPWAARRMKLELAPKQKLALETALNSKVSIITGGPGVGKTTIIRALVEIYGVRQLDVKLAAPTGRASRRMSEATGADAQTLHRLLKYNPQFHHFDYNRENPLPGDVFIVDEASMIDLPLAKDFLNALFDTAHVILVGDIDQLPSVGPGNVLRDLISSGAIPCVSLDVIFRQRTGGAIVRNAHRINRGETIEPAARGEDSDFFFVPCEDPDRMLNIMVELVSSRIPNRFRLSPITDVQVLTPMRRNSLGSDNINQILQSALNPTGIAVQRMGRTYRVGDRLMQIRNNYDKNVFNGDIGFLSAINTEQHTLEVLFDDIRVEYDFTDLDELTHAFACSIHKSQGSEYPAVVVLLATQHFKLLQRNLLYTAITRGRKLVCLIGSPRALSMAIRNTETRQRRTALAEKMQIDL